MGTDLIHSTSSVGIIHTSDNDVRDFVRSSSASVLHSGSVFHSGSAHGIFSSGSSRLASDPVSDGRIGEETDTEDGSETESECGADSAEHEEDFPMHVDEPDLEERDQVEEDPAIQRTNELMASLGELLESSLTDSVRPTPARVLSWNRLLELVVELKRQGTVITKRDLFYMDPALFVSQSFVDKAVVRLANAYGVTRDSLNVVASARGFAVGCVKVLEGGALVTNYGVPTTTGHLISPRLQFESVQVESEAAFVLVVEKDAVFSRILSEGDLAALPPCVVVTGRGYPDLATRRFVKLIAQAYPKCPIFFLSDYDPHGLAICAQYWLNRATTIADRSDPLPLASYIGPSMRDCTDPLVAPAFLPLTAADRRRAMLLLQDPYLPAPLRRELQHMLHSSVKAETEALYARPNYLYQAVMQALAVHQ